VTISESTGTVTVFKSGEMMANIHKPTHAASSLAEGD
jgi:DNA integrity scanning protein DisA with diadenylate cyclase activity